MKLDRLLKQIKREELVQLTQDLIRIQSVRRQGVGGNEKWVSADDLYLTAKIYAASALEFLGTIE